MATHRAYIPLVQGLLKAAVLPTPTPPPPGAWQRLGTLWVVPAGGPLGPRSAAGLQGLEARAAAPTPTTHGTCPHGRELSKKTSEGWPNPEVQPGQTRLHL